MSDPSFHLRPFTETDLELLARFATDPVFSEPFEWSGFTAPSRFRQRFEKDGFLEEDPHLLAVAQADGIGVGWVMWRDPNLFGRQGGTWEIGVVLAPEHRGKGAGTAAQRLLARHLFDTTPAHRLTAHTEVDNTAERRCLEKCGFRREGVMREAGFRGGRWRDVILYARLREDEEPSRE